jgi:hypothetical protein
MIKHIRPKVTPATATSWSNLNAAEVELTSEDPHYPIEGALVVDRPNGWRAAVPGLQSITLIWPNPIRVRRIRLVFEEQSKARTQEFVLRASTTDGVRVVVHKSADVIRASHDIRSGS